MKSWMNNSVLGRILIIVGTLAVINTLSPIYFYENSRDWPAVKGTVTLSKMLGLIMHFRRAITYTYQADSKAFTRTQIIPRDPWIDELKEGSIIPLRYKIDEPKFVMIDHQQIWQNILLAAWNGVWIVAGLILIKRKS
jgi:hypothetical protein